MGGAEVFGLSDSVNGESYQRRKNPGGPADFIEECNQMSSGYSWDEYLKDIQVERSNRQIRNKYGARFGSTYIKIRTIQRRLAWPEIRNEYEVLQSTLSLEFAAYKQWLKQCTIDGLT